MPSGKEPLGEHQLSPDQELARQAADSIGQGLDMMEAHGHIPFPFRLPTRHSRKDASPEVKREVFEHNRRAYFMALEELMRRGVQVDLAGEQVYYYDSRARLVGSDENWTVMDSAIPLQRGAELYLWEKTRRDTDGSLSATAFLIERPPEQELGEAA